MTFAQLAAFAVEVVARVVRAVLDAKEGRLTPEQALELIADAGRQDAAIDARVDAAIAKKFPDAAGPK